jgi:hypothetical protein
MWVFLFVLEWYHLLLLRKILLQYFVRKNMTLTAEKRIEKGKISLPMYF